MKSHAKIYCCTEPGCTEKFDKSHKLREHLCVHRGDLPFHCIHCEEKFGTKREWRKHQHLKHDPGRHCCSEENCHQIFTRFLDLRKHMKEQHPERLLHICEECSIIFRLKQEHKLHMMKHEGKTPEFKCKAEECDKSFATRSALNYHIKTIHNAAAKFPCTHPDCGKEFPYKHTLNRHMKIHERPEPLVPLKRTVSTEVQLIGADQPYHKKRKRNESVESAASPLDPLPSSFSAAPSLSLLSSSTSLPTVKSELYCSSFCFDPSQAISPSLSPKLSVELTNENEANKTDNVTRSEAVIAAS